MNVHYIPDSEEVRNIVAESKIFVYDVDAGEGRIQGFSFLNPSSVQLAWSIDVVKSHKIVGVAAKQPFEKVCILFSSWPSVPTSWHFQKYFHLVCQKAQPATNMLLKQWKVIKCAFVDKKVKKKPVCHISVTIGMSISRSLLSKKAKQ